MEIIDLISPQRLTKQQQKEAASQLANVRAVSQKEMTDADRMVANLLQLRFQLEDYIGNEKFNADKTFGFFLKGYLLVIQKKRNEFAAEISIHETLLSQLINNHREPDENIIIRLELHSNNTIPAAYWYRLVKKQKEHTIQTDQKLRKREKKFVKKQLSVSL
jgi:plasmid maintenance system antidote protein VapI